MKSRICDTPQQGSTEFLKKKKKKTQKLLSWRDTMGPNRLLKESKM